MAFVHKSFRVKQKTYVNGSMHNPGDVVVIRYDPMVGYPGGDVLEELKDSPKGDDEMAVRHKAELDKFDRVGEREALIAKQQKERTDFNLQRAAKELEERQKRQKEHLAAHQKSEAEAFEKNPTKLPAPPETVKEDLDKRHKEETEALAKSHTEEAEALKKAQGKEPEAKAPPPPPASPPPAPVA